MNTTEQNLKILCPSTGKKVNLRIIYDVAMGKACPVWVAPIFIECSEDDVCCACRQKDDKCLLLNENMPLNGMECL